MLKVFFRKAIGLIATVFVVIGASEFAVRITGVTDVPIFIPDSLIGYYPKPSQSGRVLRGNRWVFNDQSLGVAEPFRYTPDGLLLVGDSVVYGGAPLDQAMHIGPLLKQATGRPVWPVAAGGWALDNELQMVLAHRDLLRTPTIVWISNTGDFGAKNGWANPVQYPSHKPVSALFYALRRTVLKPRDVVDSPESPEATRRWRMDLQNFLDTYHGRLIWVFYPKKDELSVHQERFLLLRQMLQGRAKIIDLNGISSWGLQDYRDPIHPNAQGDRLLANVIANNLREQPTDSSRKL